ncbi:hypothetical protein [Zoogloea sp.]
MFRASAQRFAVIALVIVVGMPIFLFRVKFLTLVTGSLKITIAF